MKTTGRVHGIISNIVIVKADGAVGQNEICYVYTGDTKMMAEVIKVIGDDAYVQVFDSTRGLKIGDRVEFEGHMLEATLAPGLLSRNYDGLQNDLEKMDGLFIARGSITEPIDYNAEWEFTPLAQAGDKVTAAGWLGEVKEQWVMHKIMVPFTMTDTYTVKSVAGAGKYKVTDTIAVLTDAEGHDHEVTMVQKWPVKQAIRCYTEKPRPSRSIRWPKAVRVLSRGRSAPARRSCSTPFRSRPKPMSLSSWRAENVPTRWSKSSRSSPNWSTPARATN